MPPKRRAASASGMKVNLLYKKTDGTVLFLEAKKDFVDLLMSFLVLPVGCVLKLLRASGTSNIQAGAANLYESVQKFDQSMMEVGKSVLTDPLPVSSAFRGGKTLTIEDSPAPTPDFYSCGYNGCSNMFSWPNARACPAHRDYGYSPRKMTIVDDDDDLPTAAKVTNAGYVKENVIFMITDDLEVYPTSTIKSIVLLNKLKVQSMADLQSIEVNVGSAEALSLLKASLVSNTVLNDVFKSYIP